MQLFVRPGVYQHCHPALNEQVAVINGQTRRWDGESVIEIDNAATISVSVGMPAGHDWH